MTKFCSQCGYENKNNAQYCKKCGNPFKTNNIGNTLNDKTNKSDNSKIIVIALIIIIIALAGIFVYSSGIFNTDDQQSAVNNAPQNQTAQPASTPTASTPSSSPTSMSILGGSFSTGSELSDKTYAEIYVGSQHAGEQVTVQIWYSRDGATLNNGNMVPAHVDSSGYISISSADAYSKFPDFATVNLYDSSGNKLLDTVSVSLSPTSGTQTF
ncbi:MAG: zinc ribbon domain-containing protein [Methanobrevibacter sp.]|uniref:zinc ribbon domain-containing protein n=1 Tax=Methanobrevibacter sp. TaxID=66852 RepID=UPI0025CBC7C7|nr:zinc ribbon domain-containing protein [Methanobrevibacter sp.]MBR0272185.1 zinc ribbon domain-containing protein [Methanobrevibacter sp.]